MLEPLLEILAFSSSINSTHIYLNKISFLRKKYETFESLCRYWEGYREYNLTYLKTISNIALSRDYQLYEKCNIYFETLPDLVHIDISHNNIKKIDKNLEKATKLEELYLFHNNIKTIENLSFNLRYLNLSFNNISKIENLDLLTNLETCELTNNNISKLENLPDSLKKLYIHNNRIKKLENLPFLDILDISDNRLKTVENLPLSLTRLDISNNDVSKLDLPISLEFLDLRYTKIKTFQNLILLTNIKWLYMPRIPIPTLIGFRIRTVTSSCMYIERNE